MHLQILLGVYLASALYIYVATYMWNTWLRGLVKDESADVRGEIEDLIAQKASLTTNILTIILLPLAATFVAASGEINHLGIAITLAEEMKKPLAEATLRRHLLELEKRA